MLAAYRQGLFPMPTGRPRDPMCWYSPVRRGILPLDALIRSRSLRRSIRDYEVTVDACCAAVIDGCADSRREAGWIDRDIATAYLRLHDLGWVHSVEVWRDGALAGGLYGVAVGGLFAGESMFSRRRDASKVALVALVEVLVAAGEAPRRVLDVQWQTPHLASLGVIEISRDEYLKRLERSLSLTLPPDFSRHPGDGRA